jgi:hypothetical protein
MASRSILSTGAARGRWASRQRSILFTEMDEAILFEALRAEFPHVAFFADNRTGRASRVVSIEESDARNVTALIPVEDGLGLAGQLLPLAGPRSGAKLPALRLYVTRCYWSWSIGRSEEEARRFSFDVPVLQPGEIAAAWKADDHGSCNVRLGSPGLADCPEDLDQWPQGWHAVNECADDRQRSSSHVRGQGLERLGGVPRVGVVCEGRAEADARRFRPTPRRLGAADRSLVRDVAAEGRSALRAGLRRSARGAAGVSPAFARPWRSWYCRA